MNKVKNNITRTFYLDVLRAIACVCIILIHLGGEIAVGDEIGGVGFWVGNVFDSLARVGVPFFVMISGALMLNEEYTFTRKKLTSHIKKLVIFFIFWSGFYAIFNAKDVIVNPSISNFVDFLFRFINGEYHLWFIPMIIGLYLLLPLLRLWVKKANKKQVQYFLFLSGIFSFAIPYLKTLISPFSDVLDKLTLIDNLNMQYVIGYVAYFILGWYLDTFEIKYEKTLYALGAIGFLVTVFGTYCLSVYTGEFNHLYDNFSLNVLFYTTACFYVIKKKFVGKQYPSGIVAQLLSHTCNNSLGIYGIHIFSMIVAYKLSISIFPLIDIVINFLIVFTVSFVATFIIKRIPLLKQVV